MAASTDANIRRFIRYITLGELPPRAQVIVPETRNVIYDIGRRTFYSYGRHFPLAEYFPAKRGRRALWLINGDEWPRRGWSQTSNHQDATRAAIAEVIADAAKRGKHIRSLVVPFSALDGAGIDHESIRALDIRADRVDTFTHTATVAAEDLPRPNYVMPSEVKRQTAERCHYYGGSVTADAKRKVSITVETTGDAAAMARADMRASHSEVRELTATTEHARWDSGANPREVPCSHCDSRGTMTRHDGTEYACYVCNGSGIRTESGAWQVHDAPVIRYGMRHWYGETVTNEDGSVTFTWQTTRHWLGDSLFTGQTTRTRQVLCHAADANAPHDARCDRCGHYLTDHGTIAKVTRQRRRYVSSFDYNEPWPLYFLATLPNDSRAATVEQGIADLAPAAIHAARAAGTEVQRQGDIFLVATQYSDAQIAALAAKRARLTQWTRGARSRKGEVGFVPPLTAAQRRADAVERRDAIRAALRANLAAARWPQTPPRQRADKRAKLVALREQMARHEARVAAGDAVCQCEGYFHRSESGVSCRQCGMPVYYHGYTVANAVRGIEQTKHDIAKVLAAPRQRSSGYCSTVSADSKTRPYGTHYGRCYNRALSAVRDIDNRIARKHAPDAADIREQVRDALTIYGTGHTATEVVTTAAGSVYVRGTVRHMPELARERRAADHRPLHLADGTWYLAVRNTVPRQR